VAWSVSATPLRPEYDYYPSITLWPQPDLEDVLAANRPIPLEQAAFPSPDGVQHRHCKVDEALQPNLAMFIATRDNTLLDEEEDGSAGQPAQPGENPALRKEDSAEPGSSGEKPVKVITAPKDSIPRPSIRPSKLGVTDMDPLVQLPGFKRSHLLEAWLHNKDVPDPKDRADILQRTHLLGHGGAAGMVAAILAQGMYWPGMKDDAQGVVSSCMPCMRYNYHKAAYHPYRCAEASKPMDHLVLDLVGPFPVSGECTYVLVVTDIASRFVWLRPIMDKSAEAVSTELLHILADFGFPKVVGSDNGSEFANKTMKAVLALLKVDFRLSSPYHPRGNGVAERHVQAALQALRKALEGDETH
jgi:hypothetical protein